MVHIRSEGIKKLPAVFYMNRRGTEPVRDWLRDELDHEDRRLVGRDIAKVEFGWPVGMPTCEPLGHGLFEVRTDPPGNRTSRVLFCMHEGQMVLLHGYIKKSTEGKKTLKREMEKAHTRRDDIKKRPRNG